MPAGGGRAALKPPISRDFRVSRIDQDEPAGAAGRHHDLAQAGDEGEVVEADPPFAAGQREAARPSG